jgi:predicted nucleic acid-binding protein
VPNNPPSSNGLPDVGLNAVRQSLISVHRASASRELRLPSAEGVFPPAFMVQPLPVVPDANWLRNDIRYACLHNRRIVLVNAANDQFLRVFCAEHVIQEVIEHSREWAATATAPVSHGDFMSRFRNEYLPVIRVVPDDGVPPTWLSPAERMRVGSLTLVDRDDVPSVVLALAVRGLFLSKDKSALRAAYGDAADLAIHAEWLEHIKAGGDAGQLMGMMQALSSGVYLGCVGAFSAARRIYMSAGPLSVVAVGALGIVGWKWLRHPSRRSLLSGVGRVFEKVGEIVVVQRDRQKRFDAALPPAPTWDVLASSNPTAAVVGRAALHLLARDPQGHLSARQLNHKLDATLSATEARVRALLRARVASMRSSAAGGRWVRRAY